MYLDGPTPHPSSGLCVPPSVANDETPGEIEAHLCGGVEQHPWPRLSAGAIITIVVVTTQQPIHANLPAEQFVDTLDRSVGHGPAGDIWLIGHDDQHKPSAAKVGNRLPDPRQDLELVCRSRRQ
jgi:hypothetical protein